MVLEGKHPPKYLQCGLPRTHLLRCHIQGGSEASGGAMDHVKNGLAGGSSAAVAVALLNPLDTIKTRWQTRPQGTACGSMHELGAQIVRAEGGFVRAMWMPGLLANASSILISTSTRMGLYPIFRSPARPVPCTPAVCFGPRCLARRDSARALYRMALGAEAHVGLDAPGAMQCKHPLARGGVKLRRTGTPVLQERDGVGVRSWRQEPRAHVWRRPVCGGGWLPVRLTALPSQKPATGLCLRMAKILCAGCGA